MANDSSRGPAHLLHSAISLTFSDKPRNGSAVIVFTARRMDGQTDGWTDGHTDGQTYLTKNSTSAADVVGNQCAR